MPKMEIGKVEMVSVEWLLQNLERSVDGFELDDAEIPGIDFHAMMLDKGGDHHFGSLCATILDKGFRIPIVVWLEDLTWYGDDVPPRITMGNGHHRLTAAILLCLDEIPVYWAEDDYMHEEVSDPDDVSLPRDWEDLPEMVSDQLYDWDNAI